MASISIRALSAGILRDVSLDVGDGECVAVVGPSGAGKTTLLRALAGLERPLRGTFELDGVDATSLPPRRRDVALVLQEPALWPHLDVLENIALPWTLRGLRKSERRERAAEIARRLRVDHLLERRPDDLSGGERQRVALARALVRSPRALLLDEPLAHLDRPLASELLDTLDSLRAERRLTTLLVTHDRDEALRLADRVAVLDRGVLRQVGAPFELLERPDDRLVAELLGDPDTSFLEGVAREADGGAWIEGAGFRIALGGSWREPAPLGERIVVGLRPDAASAVTETAPAASFVEARLERCRPVAGGLMARGRLADGSAVSWWHDRGAPLAARGEAVRLTVDGASAWVFTTDDGRRIRP